ncbi:MAG: dTDP-glucose 4,6-dehydratase [Heliobacteriaceae bacterium]|nr:dTDP-glucose 4,6-dehydratase [Heliobacteriaceae bacterium]MDD4587586.1 dTDP-glucose 4,6-dehydratase [Heliobacteriaceae bacterium]
MKTILVTGGAGFIGCNFIRHGLLHTGELIVNLDRLTYAGNQASLAPIFDHPRHHFVQGDITNSALVRKLLQNHKPAAIVHLAAESHVDRSIRGPFPFVQTNIVGTFRLLETVRRYWLTLPAGEQADFRFLHVSTDEVYGSLLPTEEAFTETSLYAPNSPYAASKAAADHLARAYHQTYGLPVLITHCSNNYGPYQYPEKLIPLMILRAIAGQPLPVYGDGRQVRDWLYVADHCRALQLVLAQGRPGLTYNIGGNTEKTNLSIVHHLCDLLDELHPRPDGKTYRHQITFVTDRPGHDRRYAVNTAKIRQELGWQPRESFPTGLRRTVKWYLANKEWCHTISGLKEQNTP